MAALWCRPYEHRQSSVTTSEVVSNCQKPLGPITTSVEQHIPTATLYADFAELQFNTWLEKYTAVWCKTVNSLIQCKCHTQNPLLRV